jgi:hypothetical protein
LVINRIGRDQNGLLRKRPQDFPQNTTKGLYSLMPRVTIGTREIVVNFQHGTTPSNYQGKRQRPDTDYTKCVILSGPSGCRDEQKEVEGEATVVRYHADPQNRKLARANALDRAIEQGILSKEERAALWATISK